ncbi:n-carbamoylsarcosine amidase [Grosmannia clavigera kw1407]|uniref:N-carbamoylsarcosine amidase n=1 Tax=Grosmannia clavigera (strain kw1407 / UAMH 11150) TaxID=655863 RepID=F0XE35_GROCL|nr:n-carbamoylsarcosine amidase [Grosmannia clavigera kw1407]EFX03771.1 n-carbamoylsarcosine amidase [Grosmannia clavigera kw1407]
MRADETAVLPGSTMSASPGLSQSAGTGTMTGSAAMGQAEVQQVRQVQMHASYQPQSQPQQLDSVAQVQALVQAQAQAQAETQPPRRRAGVACRRCRRQRTKCLHQQGQAPCDSCAAAGAAVAATCSFPTRGEKDTDRLFRRRNNGQLIGQDGLVSRLSSSPPDRMSTASPRPPPSPPQSSCTSTTSAAIITTATASTTAPSFPPHDEIVEGCKVFMSSYFQLGFLPKAVFLERLHRHPETASRFLLASMLTISSRFTPVLVRRYGSPAATTEFFLATARDMAAAHDNMYRPSLERTQAFFLLAIAEWGNGDRDRSSVHMGVAVRMAALLKLHREEAYVLPPTASSDQIVRAESARRTFWMIMSQENLHAGHMTPAPFAREDISACLPCDEADFAFGILPSAATHNERAALAGTLPALRRPELASLPNRCLFATLIQAHDLWGRVARCTASEPCPWEPDSSFRDLTEALRLWEDAIPARHRWSVWNLRGWCAESLHLAYLSVVMVVRLGNIVIRRIYLERIIKALDADDDDSNSDRTASAFWQTVSYDLFANVLELHEQVDAYARMRMRDEGFPAILVFCAYMCGSLTSYLGRHPRLCPHISPAEAQDMSRGAIKVLSELQPAWPTSAKWHQGLQQASHADAAAAAAAAVVLEAPPPSPAAAATRTNYAGETSTCIATMHDEGAALERHPFSVSVVQAPTPLPPRPWDGNTPRERNGGFEIVPGSFSLADNVNSSYAIFPPLDPFLDDHFSAEVTAFLGGDFQYGLLDMCRLRTSHTQPTQTRSTMAAITHEESASYAASGYGGRMGWGARPALVLIDMCKAYWTAGSPLDLSAFAEAVAVPESAAHLVAAARAGGVPVLWTAVEYTDADMADAGLFWHKAKTLAVWQVGGALHRRGLADWVSPDLTPGPRDVVVKKKYPSGFFGTTLATELQCRNVDTVVLCGVSTSGCVRATTLDAMQYGFRPMVVASACGDRSKAIQEANLFDLDSKYADVVTEEDAVAHLKAGWKE